MVQTIARIKKEGKHFEILVDLQGALNYKKIGTGNLRNIMAIDKVFSNHKAGDIASTADLTKSFGTADTNAIADIILKKGEILVNQEFRDEEKENKIKQVVDYISRNAVDPKTSNPHTPDRIKSAIEQAHINIKNAPVEEQMNEIITKLNSILPLKFETKKIKLKIPAQFTGQVYSILNIYKEKEEWNNDGSLECTINIPAGALMSFYDKLNSVTHGSALAEEIKEK